MLKYFKKKREERIDFKRLIATEKLKNIYYEQGLKVTGVDYNFNSVRVDFMNGDIPRKHVVWTEMEEVYRGISLWVFEQMIEQEKR